MWIISWVILGLIAGFIGSKIVNRRGEGIRLDIPYGPITGFWPLATDCGDERTTRE
jgi:uncharacterized membrane protein YeaQ/YmgE (transglycosylase-associated protein family)